VLTYRQRHRSLRDRAQAPAGRRRLAAGRSDRLANRPATVFAASTALVLLGWGTAEPIRAPEPPTHRPVVQHELITIASISSTASDLRPPSPTSTPRAPTNVDIPATGTGRFAVTHGQTAVAGDGNLVQYTVEIEEGLPYEPQQVAQVVDDTLADPRSWIANGMHAFQRVESSGNVRVLLATPSTTDELCAPLRTRGEVSCRNGELVVLNAKRWQQGIEPYGSDIDGYRQYMINHEFGHALSYSHVDCPGPGETAPVMLQQSYGLDGCVPNPWPYP
jgi:hypothetical protein